MTLTFLILNLFSFIFINQSFAGKIALSFDDAPRKITPLLKNQNRDEVLIEELKSANVSKALFFVNTFGVFKEDLKGRVKQYNDAGFYIANHTHSHPWPDDIGAKAYIKNVIKAHGILKKYSNFIPYFRYPYLDYGKTVETRDTLKRELKKLGYKNGYVTVDNSDWYMDRAVQSAIQAGKNINLTKLKQAYIEALWDSIKFYDNLSKQVLGRSVPHVLLLHENDLAALFVGDLVEFLQAQGWEIIDPMEAYKDPIASMEPDTLRNNNGRLVAIAEEQGYKGSTQDQYQSKQAIDQLFEDRGVFE